MEEALAFLEREAPETGLIADLKTGGLERALVEALRRRGLVGRTVVSAVYPAWLRAVGRLEPRLPRSLSYLRDRLGVGRRRALRPIAALLVRLEALGVDGVVTNDPRIFRATLQP